MTKTSLLFFIIIMLSGCVHTTSLPSVTENQLETEVMALKESIHHDKIIARGDQIKISTPGVNVDINAIVGQRYRSALNFDCHWLKIKGTKFDRDPISICKNEQEEWFVTPRIWSQTY